MDLLSPNAIHTCGDAPGFDRIGHGCENTRRFIDAGELGKVGDGRRRPVSYATRGSRALKVRNAPGYPNNAPSQSRTRLSGKINV